MKPPAAIATGERAERTSRPGATNERISTAAAGWIARSTTPAVSITGSSVTPATRRRSARASARPTVSGAWRTSASVNRSHSPRASSNPWWHAHDFPTQPGGTGLPASTRTRSVADSASLRSGRVGRLVVDDDHLERPVLLGRERGDRSTHAALFVTRRHDDRHERAVTRRLDVVQR